MQAHPSPLFAVRRFGRLACLAWGCGVVGLGGVDAAASELMAALPADVNRPAPVMRAAADCGQGQPAPLRVQPAPVHVHQHPGRGGDCQSGRCAHGRCRHGACRNGGCEIEGCPACCPVRPASFGFYGTQWRTWPGQGVVQAAHAAPAAPVMPPKSEVPSAAEESPIPNFEPPQPAKEPDLEPAEGTPAPALPSVEPDTLPAPAKPELPTETESRPRGKQEVPPPEKEPQQKQAPADNLFDEAALQRRSRERIAMLQQEVRHRELIRQQALRQQANRTRRPLDAVVTAGGEDGMEQTPATGNRRSDSASVAAEPVTRAAHAQPEPTVPRSTPNHRPRNPLR